MFEKTDNDGPIAELDKERPPEDPNKSSSSGSGKPPPSRTAAHAKAREKEPKDPKRRRTE